MKANRPTSDKVKIIGTEGCKFFLADDIRIEQGGKPSLLGFYPDSTIVLQVPKEENNPSDTSPMGLASIAILASFTGMGGDYNMTLELVGPRNLTMGKSSGLKLTG